MKTLFVLLTAAFCLLIFPFESNAQQNQTATQPVPRPSPEDDTKNDDIVILANVRARELTFEVVPNTNVEFPGTHKRATVWEDERQNLPRPVQPGVTYRNIGIQLRITSRFVEIERIVAEALGEVPFSDNPPTTVQDKPFIPNQPNSQQAPPTQSNKPQQETNAQNQSPKPQ